MNGRPLPTPEPGAEGESADPWTIGRLLGATAEYLGKRGSETPRLDAEVMLAQVLKCQRVELYTQFDREVGDEPRGAFRELVLRRARGAPVAYLVGRKEFYSLPFVVNPSVLIPRPESEFVVVEYLEQTRHVEAPRAVDVGTGSGCLAIASAHRQPEARFIAIDLSEPALEVARRNAVSLGVADRIDFRQGDLLAPVAGLPPFDAIISNPPYIPTAAIEHLDRGVRDYEPRMAVDGGPSGVDVVARLIEQSVPLLKPGGHLILEIGTGQEQPVRSLIEAQDLFKLAPTVRDHAGHPRVIRAKKSGG
jgi:release factor glutamine methyltransferase